DLMSADVTDDAAGYVVVEEPLGARGRTGRMRAEAGRLDHSTDGSLGYELAGANRAAPIPVLVRIQAPQAARLALSLLNVGELLEADNRRLVGDDVLSGAHGADVNAGAIGRHGRA